MEVARAAENYASSTFNFTGYTMAALLFIAVTIPLARVTDWLVERDRRGCGPPADERRRAPLLRLEGCTRATAIQVLRGIDLDVPAHKVICLIGASGSGKSTLLKCANLIEPVTEGRILFEGEEITGEQTRMTIACASTSGSCSRLSTSFRT